MLKYEQIQESKHKLKFNAIYQIYSYKTKKEMKLIEVRINNFDLLTQMENVKLRKYDLITKDLSFIYKCKIKTI